jgi:hypothetical protein
MASETNEPVPQLDPHLAALQSQMQRLQAQGEDGANWFYWVAGLSLVNSVIAFVGGGVTFVIGLGITEVVDELAAELAVERPEMSLVAKAGAFGFALAAAVFAAGFGWLANKRYIPLFALGMLLYALDGMIYVLAQSWFSAAFHAFALFGMWQGLSAYRELSAILRSPPA